MHTSLCLLDLSIKGQCHDGMGGATNSSESFPHKYLFGADSIFHAKIRIQKFSVASQHLNAPHHIATTSASIMTRLPAEDIRWMGMFK